MAILREMAAGMNRPCSRRSSGTRAMPALIAAAVIGLFNVVLRPVLVILTLPVTVITLGLFLFVINALLFWAAASLMDGFGVNGFWAAMLGSLIYSALMLVVDAAVKAVRAELDAVCGKEFVLADDNGLKCVPKPETKEATKK